MAGNSKSKKKNTASYPAALGACLFLFMASFALNSLGAAFFYVAFFLNLLAVFLFPFCVSVECRRMMKDRVSLKSFNKAEYIYRYSWGLCLTFEAAVTALVYIIILCLPDTFLPGTGHELLYFFFPPVFILFSFSHILSSADAAYLKRNRFYYHFGILLMIALPVIIIMVSVFHRHATITANLLDNAAAGDAHIAFACTLSMCIFALVLWIYMLFLHSGVRRKFARRIAADKTRINEAGMILLSKASFSNLLALLPIGLIVPAVYFIFSCGMDDVLGEQLGLYRLGAALGITVPFYSYPVIFALLLANKDSRQFYLAHLHHEIPELRTRICDTLRNILIPAVFVSAFMLGCAETIASAMYGASGLFLSMVIRIGAMGLPFAVLLGGTSCIFLYIRKSNYVLISGVIAFFVSLCISFACRDGVGAKVFMPVTAVVLFFIISSVVSLIFLNNYLSAKIPAVIVLKTLACVLIPLIIFVGLDLLFIFTPVSPYIILVAAFIIGGFSFFYMSCSMAVLNKQNIKEMPISDFMINMAKRMRILKNEE
ncbi:MAG: hypothetical protein IKO53_02960 [Lachnospiraceae bacterium]|nr:hypothetical protein [Lachnospiraceae bacterium]